MRARDVLAVYDLTVTWLLTQTADLVGRLFGLPLAPILVILKLTIRYARYALTSLVTVGFLGPN